MCIPHHFKFDEVGFMFVVQEIIYLEFFCVYLKIIRILVLLGGMLEKNRLD